jgi:hypothetical protein
MTNSLFQTHEYQAIVISYLEETIDFLFEKNQEFSIACATHHLTFDPPLPENILDGFGERVLFTLVGYTYETARIEDGYFYFEAGFGDSNFGSVVSMPILAIKQIYVGDHIIAINMTNPVIERGKKLEKDKDGGASKSMEALLNNPKNKRFLKK